VASELARHGDPQAALRAYAAWLAEPNLGEAERRIAAGGAAALQSRLGNISAGLAVLENAGFAQGTESQQLKALRIVRVGKPIALAVLALFGVASIIAALGLVRARGWRRVLSWQRVAVALYALGLPLWLGQSYDDALRARFGWLLAGLGGVLLLASLAGAGLQALHARRRWAITLAANAALSCAAVGFLAAERTELFVSLLQWYGL
jgi:hypothetical protein